MRIAFPHRPPQKGGPGSFQSRFEKELKKNGWGVTYPDDNIKPDVIMVVGGTRKLGWLFRYKRMGVPIIYRLDGINWLHRNLNVSLKKWLLDELRNYLSQLKRSFLSDHIIYQSKFVEEWWKKSGWSTNSKTTIIYNGIDLNEFKPSNTVNKPISLLCVEGNIDYSPYAINLLNYLQKQLIEKSDYESLIVYGGFQTESNREKLDNSIDYRGLVARDEVPSVYGNAVYLSLDVNPACPNTVIEALASGLPVIGFDTGSLRELVDEEAGKIVPYGSDPWKLDFPDVGNLCEAALKVASDWETYSKHARKRAEEKFDINNVVDRYISTIEKELD